MAVANRSKVSCVVRLLVPLIVVLVALTAMVWPLWDLSARYDKTTQDVSDRMSRYERLLGQRSQLESQLAQMTTDQKKSGLFLESGNAELAAAQLLTKVKDAVSSAGGTLVSTQNVAPVSNDDTGEVRIKVRMSGDADALAEMLHSLESAHPLMFVRDLSIRSRKTVQGRRDNRVTTYSLDVSFDLVSFMLKGVP